MYRVNLLLYTRGENGWKFQPVRKTPRGKFVWDRNDNGTYYLEWYEDGKRKRKPAGIRPAEVLETRRRKILELKGRRIELGRMVASGASDEETPVALTKTIESYLNHLKINQKLNTGARGKAVRDKATNPPLSWAMNPSQLHAVKDDWNARVGRSDPCQSDPNIDRVHCFFDSGFSSCGALSRKPE